MGCVGKIFREVREEEGRCFWGRGQRGGSVESGRWLGYGGVFREVREVIGLVFWGRKWGKCGEREVVGLWGRFLGK